MKENNVLLPVGAFSALYTGRVKLYPSRDGGEFVAQTMVCDHPIFNPHKLEKQKNTSRILSDLSDSSPSNALSNLLDSSSPGCEGEALTTRDANFQRAMRRARQMIFDYAMSTSSFKYFVTLTISPEVAERSSWDSVIKKMSVWLQNAVARKGLTYLLVPEFHSDGESIHFHGFFNEAFDLVESGKKTKDGKKIFNIPAFKLGFNTAIEISGDYTHACKYILKYVGKNSQKVGKRFYLSGGNLGHPRFEYFNADITDFSEGYTFTPEGSNITFKIKNSV